MTDTSPDATPRTAPTRRSVLRTGLGGLALAGVATAGLGRPAAAMSARSQLPARLAGAGSAGGMNWTGWAQAAPGLVTDTPLACLARPFGGTLDGALIWLFARDENNRILANNSADGQNWVGWSEVPGGGQTDSAVAAGIGPQGAIVLAVKGLDQAVWLNSTSDGSNWSGWGSIGGATNVSPLLAEPTLHVYAVGTDDEIFSNSTTDLQTFTGWALVPGNGLTDASMCLDGFNFSGAGGADVLFAKGLDSRIYYNPVDITSGVSPSIVGKWTEVAGGGLTDSAPAVTGFSDFIDALLFVKGFQDQRIFVNRADGFPNFGAWAEVPGGGLTNVAPCVTSVFDAFGGAQIFLFAVGTDGTPFVNIGS